MKRVKRVVVVLLVLSVLYVSGSNSSAVSQNFDDSLPLSLTIKDLLTPDLPLSLRVSFLLQQLPEYLQLPFSSLSVSKLSAKLK